MLPSWQLHEPATVLVVERQARALESGWERENALHTLADRLIREEFLDAAERVARALETWTAERAELLA